MILHPVELACFHYSGFSSVKNLPVDFATIDSIALYILSVALVLSLRWTGVTRYGALWMPGLSSKTRKASAIAQRTPKHGLYITKIRKAD